MVMPVHIGTPWSVIGITIMAFPPFTRTYISLCCFQFPSVSAAGTCQPSEQREDMSPPAENLAARGQLEDLQHVDMGSAPAFFEECLHRGLVPNNGRATKVLRQLAILYLNDQNSQLATIRMEPSYADGVMVVIALKLTGL